MDFFPDPMESGNLKIKGQRRPLAQPQGDTDRGFMAGYQCSTPYPAATVSLAVEDPVFSLGIQDRTHRKGVEFDTGLGNFTLAGNDAVMGSVSEMEDGSSLVYDMGHGTSEQQPAFLESMVTSVRDAGLSEQDCNIVWRKNFKSKLVIDSTDLQVVEHRCEVTEKKEGYVIRGGDQDLCQLVCKRSDSPHQTLNEGVICNSQVLCSENGDYNEGKQYVVFCDTKSEGAFGEAVMCEDLKTHKTYIRKKVHGQLSRNEVTVPVIMKGTAGIPAVYGVISKGKTTEIYQEHAGLSLRRLCKSEYAPRIRDPGMLLGLAFQGFATLDKLHSKGIQHLDIKPENICVDMGQKVPSLKLIDFGTSQMPGEVVTAGLTYEYLSPESCLNILKVATGQPPPSEGRLGPGADVWAFAQSLLYCLCGYDVMVYMCTEKTAYPTDLRPEELERKRVECLLKTQRMTDKDITSRLIHPEWPQVLQVLLVNTLRVNPEQRWSAGQAAAFILEYLKTVAQKSAAPPQVVAPVSGFTLAPSNLSLRVHTSQNGQKNLPVQFTSIAAPSAQLPAFGELLPHSLNKMEAKSGKRRCQEESSRRGYKVMKM